jgi:organic radical activating enzyme
MLKKPFVPNIFYHILGRCNLSCRGCNTHSDYVEMNYTQNHRTLAKDLNIIQQRFNLVTLSLTGGEPLMDNHIQQVVETCLECLPNTIIRLQTNGILLNKHYEWIANLLSKHERFKVFVSCHWDPEIDSDYTHKFIKNTSMLMTEINGHEFTTDEVRDFINDKILNDPNIDTLAYLPYYNITDNLIIAAWPFKSWRYTPRDSDNLPTQYDHDDIDMAYDICDCKGLRMLPGGKLTKCANTQHLKELLTRKDMLDKWPLLRDYKDYDLYEDHDDDKFMSMHGPEDVCRNCPSQRDQRVYKKTDERSKIVIAKS